LELRGDLRALVADRREPARPPREGPVVHRAGPRPAGVAGGGPAGAMPEDLRLGHRGAVETIAPVDPARGLAARVEAGGTRPALLVDQYAAHHEVGLRRDDELDGTVVDPVGIETLHHL